MEGERRGIVARLVANPASRKSAAAVLGLLAFLALFQGSVKKGAVSSATALGSMDIKRPFLSEETAADPRADRGLVYSDYIVVPGDTASEIAERYNVTLDTIISVNDIRAARTIQPGQKLRIPSMAGILYTAKAGDTATTVAAANKISADRVIEANHLMAEELAPGTSYFLPDARLASFQLREISGDLFRWPARGWITSWFGYRSDPFTGTRTFHNGLDIGVDSGTPVLAAMEGRVVETGYSSTSGNYVFVAHHSGWSSFYGHMSVVTAKAGQAVSVGTRLGLSGNTGYTTGPHLHFSVFKYGRTVNPANVLH